MFNGIVFRFRFGWQFRYQNDFKICLRRIHRYENDDTKDYLGVFD